MRNNPLRSSAGFTLIAALTVVVIIGIVLGASAQSWQMFMKREREEELLFRGTQIRDAIKRWYNPNLKPSPAGAPPPVLQPTANNPLKDLKYLLHDPKSAETKKYLRRLYKDPITNEDFITVLDGSQNIIGVKSSSDKEPVKVGNFPADLKDLAGKQKYSDWQFVYRQVELAAGGKSGVTGLPVTTGTSDTAGTPSVPGKSGGPGGSGRSRGSGTNRERE